MTNLLLITIRLFVRWPIVTVNVMSYILCWMWEHRADKKEAEKVVVLRELQRAIIYTTR